jgi:hypothetical protein
VVGADPTLDTSGSFRARNLSISLPKLSSMRLARRSPRSAVEEIPEEGSWSKAAEPKLVFLIFVFLVF